MQLIKSYYFLIGVIIILLLTIIALHIECLAINDSSIILAFVGILATFVVISNYTQVKDIERKFENKTESFDKKIKEIDTNILNIAKYAESINKQYYDTVEMSARLMTLQSDLYFKLKDYQSSFHLMLHSIYEYVKINEVKEDYVDYPGIWNIK
ncbi:MAG: hypothetical protein LBR55_00860 [Bacteroidales bacterium]|jgi:hypothetical protein|nr:hypothetical protein [Bacteroidales bacterium]